MLELNVNNETSRLLAVVLGTAKSNGAIPTVEECYDPKSRENVIKETYPTEKDMIIELGELENVLLKYNIKVFRPDIINHYNQIFSRDIGFVIDDTFIIFSYNLLFSTIVFVVTEQIFLINRSVNWNIHYQS